MSYSLYIKGSQKPLGTVTDAQVQSLVDLLEEEGTTDQDYFIDADMLDYLEDQGVDQGLLALLRPHVTGTDGVEILWKESKP